MHKFFTTKLTNSQVVKIQEIATKLSVLDDWLAFVLYFESKFKTTATNPNSGAVGLIQFTRDKSGVSYKTISGVKYQLNDIKNMNFNQQMDLVYKYYKEHNKTISSCTETYLVTFFPNAIGKPDNYVLETKSLPASLIASQNPIFNTNKDNKILKSEVTNFIDARYKSYTNELPKKKILT